MSEITRTEKFLRACIDGEPCALKPLTRMEKLLAELNETLAGGGSASAGGGVKYAYISCGERQDFAMPPIATHMYPVLSFDSSYDELYAAYQSGVYPVVGITLTAETATATNFLPLAAINTELGFESLNFSAYVAGITYTVIVNKEGGPMVVAYLPE